MKCLRCDADGEGEARGRCLYLAGVPGTGKTALVLEVMQAARQRMQAGSLAPLQFVEINALRLPSPHHAYVCLHEVGGWSDRVVQPGGGGCVALLRACRTASIYRIALSMQAAADTYDTCRDSCYDSQHN